MPETPDADAEFEALVQTAGVMVARLHEGVQGIATAEIWSLTELGLDALLATGHVNSTDEGMRVGREIGRIGRHVVMARILSATAPQATAVWYRFFTDDEGVERRQVGVMDEHGRPVTVDAESAAVVTFCIDHLALRLDLMSTTAMHDAVGKVPAVDLRRVLRNDVCPDSPQDLRRVAAEIAAQFR